MKSSNPWLLGLVLAFTFSPAGRAQCKLSLTEPKVCAHASLLVTIHCRNGSAGLWEWLEADDRHAAWELTRPDGTSEVAYRGRYSFAPQLLALPPGEELSYTAPLTRWFALAEVGKYSLRFRLIDASGSTLAESNATEFQSLRCDGEGVLAACRSFLTRNPPDMEPIGGFDSEAALPCMDEALARNAPNSASVIEALERLKTPEATSLLVKYFHKANAFDRLAIWQALHNVDTSILSPELREKVTKVLSEKPISWKE